MTPAERQAAFAACPRSLDRHPRKTCRQVLEELAARTDPEARPDHYGAGGPVAALEQRVADLLGFPAAVFFPSGTMAQPIALRLWCERAGVDQVAFHPTSHLELHEHKGYQRLHGLQAVTVGGPTRLLTVADLEAVAGGLGAVLIELPQRELGGLLPSWEELTEVVDWCREAGVAVHLDGARLWECQPYYQRSLAEIAGLFDSVYVSFYKTLGALTGAALVGPEGFLAEARIWQRRHGGNLVHLYPEALSAGQALDDRLDKVPAYVAACQRVAAVLAEFPRLRLVPDPPVTNMVHVLVEGEREALLDAAAQVAQEAGVAPLRGLGPTEVPGFWRYEFAAGDATLEVGDDEVRRLFTRLFELAG